MVWTNFIVDLLRLPVIVPPAVRPWSPCRPRSSTGPSLVPVGGGEFLEVGDDPLDVGAGTGDAASAQLDQEAGPLDPLGEHVDVEVVALELVEDVAELGHGVGVPDGVVGIALVGGGGHRLAHSSVSSTRLVSLPSASSV